ncbi:MAG: tetratricopeptide repeat protein [Terriglobales bacterium]
MARRVAWFKEAFLLTAMASLATVAWLCVPQTAWAGDLRITMPKHSELTPVQRLNREGVEAVRKNRLNKAKELFYKAYVLDPGDPFTLNNLGYVAELEGQVERAQQFYSMASSQATDARIDLASSSNLKGQSLENAFASLGSISMQVNRANLQAIELIQHGRLREATEVLGTALNLDPTNAFTLNNLGVEKEAEGEYEQALNYYDAAARSHSEDEVIVTTSAAWRGKPLNAMARSSAARLRARMKTLLSTEEQVASLNRRGVSALNRNDLNEATEYFGEAYRMDPNNAFSLNNQGYMAEVSGDLESAQDFYREAHSAKDAVARVGLATRSTAEGQRLFAVADHSEEQVSNAVEIAATAKRHSNGPIELKHRDGTPVIEPPAEAPPVAPASPVEPPQSLPPR